MRRPKTQISAYINYKFRIFPCIHYFQLLYKHKWGTPRCEREPYLLIEWLWWGIQVTRGTNQYWEQWLWIHKYCDGDEERAKKSWPWTGLYDKLSTWKDY